MPFTKEQEYQLEQCFSDTLHQFVYQPNEEKVKELASQWESDNVLLPAELSSTVKFTGICESFARVCMQKCITAGFQARLVVCNDEFGEGHCVCEVSDSTYDQAVIMDNRHADLVTKSQLESLGYKFLGTSPWNPVTNDPRPWDLTCE